MKKKLLFFVLLFALVFSIGCSNESDDDDSPSKKVTSTPIPENLAKKQDGFLDPADAKDIIFFYSKDLCRCSFLLS